MGKEAGGREKELMLEISRKEAKYFSALLAEILGKMGSSRAKLRDLVPPPLAVSPICRGNSCWPTGT